MTAKTFFSLAAAVAASVLVGSTAVAQADTNILARTYTVKAKPGMSTQFEAALREHAQWRADNGDPWDWNVTMRETGEALGTYGIRSGGHSWADFDAYDAGFGPQGLVHWNATVAPLVESVSSAITTTDQELSNPPPAGTAYAFVTITKFHLRPGQEMEFNRLIAEATEIIRDKLPGYWVWSSPISGGGPGPYIDLVGFPEDWADMADPDPSFEAIMVQEMGQDGFLEWWTNLGQTYRGTDSYTLRRRPDMDVR
jgi:hypothetical protein